MSSTPNTVNPDVSNFRPNELKIDTAYQQIDEATWGTLIGKATDAGVFSKRDAMFAGKHINQSENRAVLHTALRNLSSSEVLVDGEDVMPTIKQVWKQIDNLCNKSVGITDIIHIGIGGSDFGPRLVCNTLHQIAPNENRHVRVHFLANIDSAELANILGKAQALTTRVIIVSKSFTTLEALQNANSVIDWLKEKGVSSSQLSKYLFGVTANPELAENFGIAKENIFPFWDWVGGRFSVWSAVGLPIALKFGFNAFKEFLAGAYAMDEHFRTAPPEENQPLLLALTLLHNQERFNIKSQALIPYAESLSDMPHWLQQLEMESNGKSTRIDGSSTKVSSPVIFGSVGSNAQHSFFQMLHQGPEIIPVDFITIKTPMSNLPNAKAHHRQLLANCLAQAQALANGQENLTDPNLNYPGGRPSNLIWLPKLDAFNLGSLLALYEHRTFCLGVLWGLNSFDQPGVELGKKLAMPIEQALSNPSDASLLDSLDKVTADRVRWLQK